MVVVVVGYVGVMGVVLELALGFVVASTGVL